MKKLFKKYVYIVALVWAGLSAYTSNAGADLDLMDFGRQIQQVIARGDLDTFSKMHPPSVDQTFIRDADYMCYVFECMGNVSNIRKLMQNPETKILTSNITTEDVDEGTEYIIVFYDPNIIDMETVTSLEDLAPHWATAYAETRVQRLNGFWFFSNMAFLYGSELPWAEDNL